jgi:hypothetical protein
MVSAVRLELLLIYRLSGYDWKLGADDCQYAFRKILGQCNDKDDRSNAGGYKYRCVNYKMWLVNM